MNKILMLICGIALVSSAVIADEAVETCANGAGKIVTGAVTGHKYCMSNKNMNWWNAYAWCDAQGRRLFSLDDCGCDNVKANCANNTCAELKGIYPTWKRFWTASPFSATRNYVVTQDLTVQGVIADVDRLGLHNDDTPLCK